MKYDEAQKFLNEQLKFCPAEHQKNIYADRTLSDLDKEDLIKMVSAYKEGKKSAVNVKRDLALIAEIMQRYVKPAGKGGQPHSKTLPFLVQQVLCYIMVLCVAKEWGYTQKDIIRELRDNLGVPISNNFFSRFKETAYIGLYYDQPELPTNYMGQKRGELAVAIKNLVYQAGEYDTFCDIFGGSGAATLAVHRRKNAKYVYNEKHRCMYNLFDIIVDANRHEDLIRDLKLLQRDLSHECIWIETSTLDKSVLDFIENKKLQTVEEEEIISSLFLDFEEQEEDILKAMESFHDYVERKNESFTFVYDNNLYSREQLLNDIFAVGNLNDCIKRFYDNFSMIVRFDRDYTRGTGFGLNLIRGTYIDKTPVSLKSKVSQNQYIDFNRIYTLAHFILYYGRIRAYKYFIYFRSLLETPGKIKAKNKSRYAVAEIFLHYFNRYNDMSPSRIYNFFASSTNAGDIPDSKLHNFIEKDYEKILCDIFKIVRGTVCEHSDCIKVIKKYQGKRTLFYSDSPYIETTGYSDVANGVKAFTAKKMQSLIKELRKSQGKFIFSCRAVKSSSSSDSNEEFKEANKSIRSSVFQQFKEEFKNKGQHLWVLAIEKKDGNTLEELMKSNGIAEIMITNFRIYPFEDPKFKRIKFRVLTFETFLKIYDKIFENS